MNTFYRIKVFTLFILLFPIILQAQDGINFQAIARDAGGNLISNGTVGIRFSISVNNPSLPFIFPAYTEEHLNVSTDAYGHFSMVIGEGNVTLGSWANIKWDVNPYKISITFNPGTGIWTSMGTMPFQSLGRAKFAAIADSVKNVSLGGLNNVNLSGAPATGSVLTWNGSEWIDGQAPPAKTRTQIIGPGAFHVQHSNNTDVSRWPAGVSLYNSPNGSLYADLSIPEGSIITAVEVMYLDNDPVNNIKFQIYRNDLGAFSNTVINYTTSGSSSAYQIQNAPLSTTLPSGVNSYHTITIRAGSSQSWTAAMVVKGIKVTYTLP